ncbi:Uncharacterised protein [BD1-7 clade bacterium]|uniref:Polyketide cyclase / dehydrase and lipid transport n=1 Tax=BD1-7 clade bacterium TaxID=2029982 RepID=A0A5S9QHP8_9GAMM|nr:Uncharacterised protein [BD1-7 clade bacterium]
MLSTTVTRELNHDCNRAWAVLADFGNVGWAAGDNTVEVIGEGIGMIRRIIVDGLDAPIDEVLDFIEPEQHKFGYSIPRGLPFPLDDYRAEAQVKFVADGRTTVVWKGWFTPQDGLAEADAIAMMDGIYNQLIDWLDAHLSGSTSG